MITINMVKARDIHRGKLRVLRVQPLADLDVAYQRAHEANDTAAMQAVVAKKNALRDITKHPSIEAAQNIEDLKKIGLP